MKIRNLVSEIADVERDNIVFSMIIRTVVPV